MIIVQDFAQNILLQTMAKADFDCLSWHLTRVTLPAGFELHTGGQKSKFIYFLEDGVASVVTATFDGKPCEVGLIGREGISETVSLLCGDKSPYDVHMVASGVGLRILSQVLQHTFDNSLTLRNVLLCYVQSLLTQSASSIAAASLTVEQRLARWILMYDDRLSGRALPVTHELIAIMLRVRRPGITVAIEQLVDRGLISKRRGALQVEDRQGLKSLSLGSYGIAEATFERLLGVSPILHRYQEQYSRLSAID